jgi:hypothetical protein
MQQLEAQGQALQQHSQQLQLQLGSPAHTKSAGNAQQKPLGGTFMSIMSGTAGGPSTADEPAARSAQGPHAGLPGGRTMAARLSRLEQQVETLAAVAADSEVGKPIICILTMFEAFYSSRQQRCGHSTLHAYTHAVAAAVPVGQTSHQATNLRALTSQQRQHSPTHAAAASLGRSTIGC